jgi:tripartite-type tricarboxylate transporter receptor subunit TctC
MHMAGSAKTRAVLLAALAVMVGVSSPACAEGSADFPSSPVRILVPFAAGGPTDVVARILADLLSQRWGGKAVVVEDRPGAGTIVATAATAKAAPDGYTLGMATNSFLINPAIGMKLPYDTRKDFSSVTMIATQPVALVANAAFPASTVAGIIALAKKSPEPLNYTSPGPRGVGDLAGAMLAQRAGIKMQHISYNGSAPALNDVMAGRVPLMFDIWHSARRYVETGQLKVIAGAGTDPLPGAETTPTIAQTFPGFNVVAFNAVIGPAGIPAPILDKLAKDIGAVVDSAAFKERVKPLGIDAWSDTPADLDTWFAQEIDKWAELAKQANIKAAE